MIAHSVVAVGQLPPPVFGQSYITQEAIYAARDGASELDICNISPRLGSAGLSKHVSRTAATLKACMHLVRRKKTSSSLCYIACDGGFGLLYIIAIVGCARIAGYNILLHHHSFAYITRSSRLMSTLLAVGGRRLAHVFLGEAMERGLQARYPAHRVTGIVLSNAAFVPPGSPQDPEPHGPLVLGHLSNLTKEKGLHIFIDLLRHALNEGHQVRAILAGPAALASDQDLIKHALDEFGDRLEYRGPLYGAEKDAFYQDIDVFVFPTQYVHEAQPTVLFEAQAVGGKIVSFDRGCIREQVQDDGLVIPQDANFVAAAFDWLAEYQDSLRTDRAATRQRYAARHEAARKTAVALFAADRAVITSSTCEIGRL